MRRDQAGGHVLHTNDSDGHNGSGHVPISIREVVGEAVLPSVPNGGGVGEGPICAEHQGAMQGLGGCCERVAAIGAQHVIGGHTARDCFGVHCAECIILRDGHVICCNK